MTITLAATWHPRGETARFERLLPRLQLTYQHIVVALPPLVEIHDLQILDGQENVQAVITSDWSHGRYVSVQEALKSNSAYIHYADMDRLLRWVETQETEWLETLKVIEQSDFLVIGRTSSAYHTHPQALIQTEAISNATISHLVGKVMDVSAGSKSFSRIAAEALTANAIAGRALGTDGEWTVLMHRLSFRVDYLEVDGLDWESADRYQEQAADLRTQKHLADEYDTNPKNWERRAQIALEIVQAGLDAAKRSL
jgi:hypothetical protein